MTNTEITTRFVAPNDAEGLLELYRAIAARPSGLVRTEDEISPEFIAKLIRRAQHGGVGIVAVEKLTGRLIGSIIARKLGLKVFDHVLSGVIVAVHSDFQKQGLGRRLFLDFLEHLQIARPDILRVELIARESNPRLLEFYESIGFRREGTFDKRIRNFNGEFEADVAMAWVKE